jgi:hypothetical protein
MHPIDQLVAGNPEAAHRAVIWLSAEVHELTKHGECAGDPKYRVERFPVYIDGLDRNLAVRKLNELFEELKSRCPGK